MENIKKLPRVAYFCMEYGIDPELKIYAGGLGVLAGDYLKIADDMDLPVVGIGIKWKYGYTDQYIDKKGWPYDEYKAYEYKNLEDTGVTVKVKVRAREVLCKVWKVNYLKNTQLYLLDTDIKENQDRWITEKLYHGFKDDRIAQEIVLGIGGIKALRKLGIHVDIYHFNEGHAVFAGFELIREKMAIGMTFSQALKSCKEKIVFTTHTPVKEGNESHNIESLLNMNANNGLTEDQLIRIGGDPFGMTPAGLRLAKISNAVAQLHNKTANEMWSDVWDKSEIIGITNGIHLPTWVDKSMIKVVEHSEQLWSNHMKNKRNLIEFIRERNGVKLKENRLIIGFARRAATYKRANLIFREESIIGPLLEDATIQLVFSGKAHPQDKGGKSIVAKLVEMQRKYPKSVVFLENYDMEIGKMMTRGCDIWLNNPRRPKEASGTSGMKAAMNGVLNLSILDGWWPEACKNGINGWQFGDGFEGKSHEESDAHDLKALYNVLENEVIPTYYEEREKWIKMMRESIYTTKDRFSMNRMVNDYYNKMYLR